MSQADTNRERLLRIRWRRFLRKRTPLQGISFPEMCMHLMVIGKEDSLDHPSLSVICPYRGRPFHFDRYLRQKIGLEFNHKWAKYFPTDLDKINAFKGLLLLEVYKERLYGSSFHISQGSVAVPIWVWNELCKAGLTSDELIKWCYENKGSNPYSPFGKVKYGYLDSVEEYKYMKAYDERRKIVHTEMLEEHKIIQKVTTSAHQKRCRRTKRLNKVKYARAGKYFLEKDNTFFEDVVNDKLQFPMGVIAKRTLTNECKKLKSRNYGELKTFLSKVPRDKSVHLKRFREKIHSFMVGKKKMKVIRL